jgi:hypothetical protein
MGAEVFYAEGRTDRQTDRQTDMMKLFAILRTRLKLGFKET